MKKTTKTVQDTGAVKVIPPYPRWVKICCAIVYWLLAIAFGERVLKLMSINFGELLFYLFFLAMFLIGGYGIYRAFRYFPKRAFCVLALVVMSEVLAQIYSIKLSYSRTIIALSPLGLILGQGILALFWKKARKWGWPVYLMALIVALGVTGRVYNGAKSYLIAHKYTYVLGDTYLRTDEDNRFENR